MKRMHLKAPPPLLRRPVNPEDAPILRGIYERCPGYFEALGAEVPTLADVRRELLAAQGDPARHRELLYLADLPVGYLDYRLGQPRPEAATLNLVLIAEPYRGQGLGRAAVLDLMRQLSPHYQRLYAVVYGKNPKAFAFFKRLGFVFERDGGPALSWFFTPLSGP